MSAALQTDSPEQSILQVYLLGSIDFEVLLTLQRHLHDEIASNRQQAALILCEHPPIITVGRQGSRGHIRLDADELRVRYWPIRWVHRGGGCVLHLPGQLAIYPILPLDRLGCGIADYLHRLNETIVALLSEFCLRGPIRASEEGVWVSERLLAAVGVSVCDWTTSFGAYVNLNPALDAYRSVIVSTKDRAPMTSLQRERRGPVRPALVRERLLVHFQQAFGFAQTVLFTDHPVLHRSQPAAPQTLSEAQRI